MNNERNKKRKKNKGEQGKKLSIIREEVNKIRDKKNQIKRIESRQK